MLTVNDLIIAFGKIDPQYIEEADSLTMPRKNHFWIMVAASVFMMLSILFVGIYIGQQENESGVSVSDYPINYKDYKIENHILLSYTGNDSIVPIPNEVNIISSKAFGANSNIKTIIIGANVEKIESGAFLELNCLEEFLVDENNKYYQVVDGLLIKKDGTLVLYDIGEYGDDRTSDDILFFVNAFIIQNKEHLDLFKQVEVGDALLHITCEYSEEGKNVRIYATALEVFGERVKFKEKEYIVNGNQKFQCFETDDYFLLSSQTGSDRDIYILYQGGHILYSENEGEYDCWGNKKGTYTQSEITFYKENGKLGYYRIPEKFYKNVDQVQGIIMDKCVAREEFYKEVGTVDIVNGEILFTAQETYTIEQCVNLEREYELWIETAKGHIPEGLSLDDYLAWNGERYERAK